MRSMTLRLEGSSSSKCRMLGSYQPQPYPMSATPTVPPLRRPLALISYTCCRKEKICKIALWSCASWTICQSLHHIPRHGTEGIPSQRGHVATELPAKPIESGLSTNIVMLIPHLRDMLQA